MSVVRIGWEIENANIRNMGYSSKKRTEITLNLHSTFILLFSKRNDLEMFYCFAMQTMDGACDGALKIVWNHVNLKEHSIIELSIWYYKRIV